MDLFKYITVFTIAISPWGEELVAIPAGILFGLNAGAVLMIAVIANIIPIVAIAYLHKLADDAHPTIKAILSKIKTDRGTEVLNKYGPIGLIAIAPWIGVYSATLITLMMGMDRRLVVLSQVISVIIYGLLALALTLLGIRFFSH